MEAFPRRRFPLLAIGLLLAVLLTTDSALAQDASRSLGAGVPVVRLGPCAAGNDGQTVFLRTPAMAAQGVTWRMRCNSASASAYKWEFIGGAPLMSQVDTGDVLAAATTTYSSLATSGPTLVAPAEGDYTVSFGFRGSGSTVNQTAAMSYALGAAAPSDADALEIDLPANLGTAASKERIERAVADETAISARYRHNQATSTVTFGDRWLRVVPIRLGYTVAIAPVMSVPPTISGLAREGDALMGSRGTFSASLPLTYTQTWLRCDLAGANCTSIGGASGMTYTPTGADIGSTLRFSVTASHESAANTQNSAQTAIVLPAAPLNTALPGLSMANASQGETITASTGSWTSQSTPSYARQWQRCSAVGSNCEDIAGATAATYRLSADDVGRQVRARVVATNPGGSTTATSALSGVITAPVLLTPTVTGGSLSWRNDASVAITGAVSYSGMITRLQHRTSRDSGITWSAPQDGAVANITQEGETLVQMRVHYVDDLYSAWAPIHPTVPDLNPTPIPDATVMIDRGSPTAATSATASALAGTPVSFTVTFSEAVSGIAAGDFSTSGSATGCVIGAPSSDAGTSVSVNVTCTGAGSLAIALAANAVSDRAGNLGPAEPATSSVSIIPPTPSLTAAPALAGASGVGQEVGVTNGTWSPEPTSYAYQWQVATAQGGPWSNAQGPGATTSTYTIHNDDAGKYLRARVVASNASGASADTGTSNVIGPISWAGPTGMIIGYAGATPPAGYLLADGTAVSRTTYAALFAVIGTTYGAGDGSSTFNLPNLQGRTPMGAGTGAQNGTSGSGAITGGTALTSRSRGQFGGDERLQSHTHDFSGNTGTENNYTSYGVASVIGGRERSIASAGQGWGVWTTYDGYTHRHPFSGNTANHNQASGDGGNMAPHVVMNFIIKATTNTTEPPENIAAPAISGAPIAGGTVTASDGTWVGSVSNTTYQWQRALPGGSFDNIAGATGSTYTPTDDDYGYCLRVRVTKSNSAGAQSDLSDPTDMVGSRIVQALPANPEDGQLATFQTAAMAAQGVAWEFMYNASSTSSYKWEYVGGRSSAIFDQSVGSWTLTHAAGTYTDLLTRTVPLAGDYLVTGSSYLQTNSGNDAIIAITNQSSRNLDHRVARSAGGGGQYETSSKTVVLYGLAANAVVALSDYHVATGSGSVIGWSDLSVVPIRVQ